VLGLTLVFQSAVYFSNWRSLKLQTSVALALTCLGGLGVLAGTLTPAPTPNILESKLVLANLIAMAAAILFLGPGAFSLDARLFGRREIFIPNPQHSPKSRSSLNDL
jgi:hypothetical protein